MKSISMGTFLSKVDQNLDQKIYITLMTFQKQIMSFPKYLNEIIKNEQILKPTLHFLFNFCYSPVCIFILKILLNNLVATV